MWTFPTYCSLISSDIRLTAIGRKLAWGGSGDHRCANGYLGSLGGRVILTLILEFAQEYGHRISVL